MGHIIIEGQDEASLPAELKAISGPGKEALVFIQEVDGQTVTDAALAARDPIYQNAVMAPYMTTNGCEAANFQLQIKTGEWTRIRMAHVTSNQGSVVDLFSNDTQGNCQVGVLAKDGIYLETIPRMIPDKKLYFTIGSRVDVVVKCDAGTEYTVTADRGSLGNVPLGKIVLVPGTGGTQGALAPFTPCRPFYLQDLTAVLPDHEISIALFVGVNSVLYDPNTYFPKNDLFEGQVVKYTVEGAFVHPWHTHINPMQVLAGNAQVRLPNWHQVGDWIDVGDAESGILSLASRLDRFSGAMTAHCHIYTHGDTGMITQFQIQSGNGPLSGTQILKQGTCPPPPA